MLRYGLLLCVYGHLATVSCLRTEQLSRTVTIDQGSVKGYMVPEGDVFVFYSIPYATAPTGTHKFRPPLPAPSWNGTFEALQKNIICPQNLALRNYEGEFQMQEDCLIANVYAPDTGETNLPVVVYFHGGAYQFGFGTSRTLVHMVQSKKMIAVNFNYRIGAHGFLCLGTEDVPGNAGIKDQVTLLRWVQRNIAQFGGNPNDVTINGCSAGGASVDLLMLSKITKGLFHKVIPESGSNTASFAIQVDPIENSREILRRLNITFGNDVNALEKFYTTAPYETLYENDLGNEKDGSIILVPCIERDVGQEMFLDEHPVNIIKNGGYPKLPMLYGITEMEGIYRMHNFDNWLDQMNEDFSNFLPDNLIFANEEEKYKVAQKVKEFYFGSELIEQNEKSVLDYVQYYTDILFGYGTAKNIRLQVEAGNDQIYLYEYSFADLSENYIRHTNVRGATHCAQARAVTDLGDESKLSEEYQHVKTFMRDLWLNFIITGKPVPEVSKYPAWPPVADDRSPYMALNGTLELRRNFLGDRAAFWDEIYENHFRLPIKPSTNNGSTKQNLSLYISCILYMTVTYIFL